MNEIRGWELLESMVQLLEPLLSLTNAFGASAHVTSSQAICEYAAVSRLIYACF
jgi:hypothetical protein